MIEANLPIHAPGWNTLVSVLVGGALAALGGFGAQRYAAWLKDKRHRAQLLHRVRVCLDTLERLAAVVAEHNSTLPFPTVIIRHVGETCAAYERLADHVILLPEMFGDELDSFLGHARLTCGGILNAESQAVHWEELAVLSGRGMTRLAAAEADVVQYREQSKVEIAAWVERILALRAELARCVGKPR